MSCVLTIPFSFSLSLFVLTFVYLRVPINGNSLLAVVVAIGRELDLMSVYLEHRFRFLGCRSVIFFIQKIANDIFATYSLKRQIEDSHDKETNSEISQYRFG